MYIHDATEQAYKRGYDDGVKDAIKINCTRCIHCHYISENTVTCDKLNIEIKDGFYCAYFER